MNNSPLEFKLWVYRRLDNRSKGLPDDSPLALELHNRRKSALHDALDHGDGWRVTEWGNTDDTRPHEWVELVLAAISSPQVQALAIPALAFIGRELTKSAVSTTAAEGVKALIARLRPKQDKKEILDFSIHLPDGTRISCYPKEGDAELNVTLRDGRVLSINYNAKQHDLPKDS
jgi:hypothetical protein